MKAIGVGACVLLCWCWESASAQTLTHVRVEHEKAAALAEALEAEGFDVLEGSVAKTSVELVVSDPDLEALLDRGLSVDVIAVGRPFNEIQEERLRNEAGPDGSVPPGYPNLAQVVAQMNAAAAAYPAICKVVDVNTAFGGPATWEGRHLMAVKVSDNVNATEDEPSMLIASCHHAREIITPVIALYAMDQLTSQYATNPTIRNLVDKYEIWIIPVANPDGYEYVLNVNNLWRKNRHQFGTAFGVDQNRNYPFGWSAACSGSTTPSSETYKGPSAGSEAETQTIMALSNAVRFDKVVDFHSYGRDVLWEYNCLTHPFASFLQSEAVAIANACSYAGSNRAPSAEGEHPEWQLAAAGRYAFLIETGTSFQPSYASAQSEAVMTWAGIQWMLNRPIPMVGHVRDSISGNPVATNITYTGVTFTNGETNGSGGPFGRYHCFLPAGSYTVNFSATGYQSQAVAMNITTNTEQVREIQLVPNLRRGDLNCDGQVNAADAGPFALALASPTAYAAAFPTCNIGLADMNNDGQRNGADVALFVACALGGPCP